MLIRDWICKRDEWQSDLGGGGSIGYIPVSRADRGRPSSLWSSSTECLRGYPHRPRGCQRLQGARDDQASQRATLRGYGEHPHSDKGPPRLSTQHPCGHVFFSGKLVDGRLTTLVPVQATSCLSGSPSFGPALQSMALDSSFASKSCRCATGMLISTAYDDSRTRRKRARLDPCLSVTVLLSNLAYCGHGTASRTVPADLDIDVTAAVRSRQAV